MLKKFTVTYADFAEGNFKNLFSKQDAFCVIGVRYKITEPFISGEHNPECFISIGNDNNNGVFCYNNIGDLRYVNDNPNDITVFQDEATDVNCYLYIETSGFTGADLTSGSIEVSIIVIDLEV